MHHNHLTYWQIVWKQFFRRPLGVFFLSLVFLFILMGIYAPLLASSQPLLVYFENEWFFPLFRYLFYPGFFTKRLDIFYNLLMFFFPLFILEIFILKKNSRFQKPVFLSTFVLLISLFIYLIYFPPKNPAFSPALLSYKQNLQKNDQSIESFSNLSWDQELALLSSYARLNLVLRYQQAQLQYNQLKKYEKQYAENQLNDHFFPTLWNLMQQQEQQERTNIQQTKERYQNDQQFAHLYQKTLNRENYLNQKQTWLKQQVSQLQYEMMPLIRFFHWEEDVAGDQQLNRLVKWWELSRINRKDLVAALIFGTRISLSVGLLAIGLALLIGIPIGALAGYYGGKIDLITYRLIEIWESMPTFFMLLMIIAFLQSKSIFLIITIIGLFGWTSFSRFIRGEFLRQKQLTYVEACRALGYSDRKIIFSHLLPNAIPPLLTLIPFAITAAITSEAGLSFLGLGEEGSNSWGVLMDEGRAAFPAESYLLWPPAFLLSLLLVSIALVGDTLRDALDPKLHKI